MVEHAATTDNGISKDLFVLGSARELSHKLMVEKDILEGDWECWCQSHARRSGGKYLPGMQGRYVNSQKEEEHQKAQRAIEEEQRKTQLALEEAERKRSVHARVGRFCISDSDGIALIAQCRASS